MQPRALAAAALALGLIASSASARDRYEIALLEGSRTPPDGVTAAAAEAMARRGAELRSAGAASVHALVQLRELPDEVERAALERDGLDLGAYVPGQAFLAALPVERAAALARRPELRWIEPWTAERKLHPRLAAGILSPWAVESSRAHEVLLFVRLHHDVELDRLAALADEVGATLVSKVVGLNGGAMWVPQPDLGALAEREEVMWIEEVGPPLSNNNAGVRGLMKVDPLLASPYNLSGSGVRLLVYDGGRIDAGHETFNAGLGSRVTWIDTSTVSDHATHVAGTAAGDGSGAPGTSGKGIATAASILSAGFQWSGGTIFWDTAGDIEADYAFARNVYQADVATNSIGSNVVYNGFPCELEGDYGVAASLIDAIVRGDDPAVTGGPVLTTWANGNERGGIYCGSAYWTTAPPACAKNPIHLGAVHSDGGAMTWFSGWGPCDDGRMKPTLVAPGCETGLLPGSDFGVLSSTFAPSYYEAYCGTSMATPGAAGVVSLLLQDWRARGYGGATDRPLPALVKALLIHSARDVGIAGPDYQFGYGQVDAKAAIDLLRAGGNNLGNLAAPSRWGTDSISQGAVDLFTFTVPSGTAAFKATIAWDDAAAAPFSASQLVNDLDLELVDPTTTVTQAWYLNSSRPTSSAWQIGNTLDNQEQVVVFDPIPGTYTVRVSGTSVPAGPQSYGLVLTTTTRTVDDAHCTTASWNFEDGTGGWTLNGAELSQPGVPTLGNRALEFGGGPTSLESATIDIAVPAHAGLAEWSFNAYVDWGLFPLGSDFLAAAVQDLSGNTLAVLAVHSEISIGFRWEPFWHLDLSPWAGQTIRLAFLGSVFLRDPARFWADEVSVTTCPRLTQTAIFSSVGAEDGHTWESTETSNAGGGAVASSSAADAIRAGDLTLDRQLRSIVSFNTAALPDGAVIVSAKLRLTRGSIAGSDPFATFGACRVDLKTGYFGPIAIDAAAAPLPPSTLAASDFQATASANNVGTLVPSPADVSRFEADLNAAGLAAINKTGTTQAKIYFSLDDNDNGLADYAGFYAGESAIAGTAPVLEVTYYVP